MLKTISKPSISFYSPYYAEHVTS